MIEINNGIVDVNLRINESNLDDFLKKNTYNKTDKWRFRFK